MPIESEKEGLPHGYEQGRGATFEKSGWKKKRRPSPPPGMSSEWIEEEDEHDKSSGMSTLAERSMPFCTPSAITKCVARAKITV